MKRLVKTAITIALLGITGFANAAADDPVTSNLLLKKGEHYNIDLRECDRGRHPIVISYHADLSKLNGPSIPNTIHFNADKTYYFTFEVEEDTEGVIAQFCHPKNIGPYFKKLKARVAEAS